jgi:hypothetical protein
MYIYRSRREEKREGKLPFLEVEMALVDGCQFLTHTRQTQKPYKTNKSEIILLPKLYHVRPVPFKKTQLLPKTASSLFSSLLLLYIYIPSFLKHGIALSRRPYWGLCAK